MASHQMMDPINNPAMASFTSRRFYLISCGNFNLLCLSYQMEIPNDRSTFVDIRLFLIHQMAKNKTISSSDDRMMNAKFYFHR
jgi:hypothetical protein